MSRSTGCPKDAAFLGDTPDRILFASHQNQDFVEGYARADRHISLEAVVDGIRDWLDLSRLRRLRNWAVVVAEMQKSHNIFESLSGHPASEHSF